MGAFLREPHARRTLVYLPPAIPHDADFNVLVSTAAYEAGEVWIEVDGRRHVTILRDGTIAIHDEVL